MNEDSSYFLWGESTDKEEIKSQLIRGLIGACQRNPFVSLIDLQRNGTEEAIIINFDVELPQFPTVPIQKKERIAIVCQPNNDEMPKILALRKDFPSTLHQNVPREGEPISLCLFEEPFSEIRLRLTPMMLLQRVADWLSRASTEELHLANQPLEPLLLSSARIIFDPDIFFSANEGKTIVIRPFSNNPLILKAFDSDKEVDKVDKSIGHKEIRYLLLPVKVPPYHLRLIEHTPLNFQKLCDLFSKLNLDIEEEARCFIKKLAKKQDWGIYQNYRLVILLDLEKTRVENGPVEAHEYWAFLISDPISDLSIKLGITAKSNGNLGFLLSNPESKDLETVSILPLKPTYLLTKQFARKLSGLEDDNDPEILCVGAGALGSQIVLNLARQGFGKWHIVDFDLLLPHNLSRHGLSFLYEVRNKAEALAFEITGLLNYGEGEVKHYPVDIVRELLSDNNNDIKQIISRSDLILDFSTSRAVSKALSLAESDAKRICAFISPNGQYLIVISEGRDRQIRLDDLEIQYLASIVDVPEIANIHSRGASEIYYSGSCRDISITLPQDTASLFAAIVSKFIKNPEFISQPKILVWKINQETLELSMIELPVSLVQIHKINGWEVHVPLSIISQMEQIRLSHLPNETGGVLVGNIDAMNKIVYIAKLLSSPEDSIEWPTMYIRGVRGLREKVEYIKSLTGEELFYVGEWHSHPRGHTSMPSLTDLQAHEYLVSEMSYEDFPGLMLIIGENDVRILLDAVEEAPE